MEEDQEARNKALDLERQVLGLEARVHIYQMLKVPIPSVFLFLRSTCELAIGLINTRSKKRRKSTISVQVGVRHTRIDLWGIVVYSKRDYLSLAHFHQTFSSSLFLFDAEKEKCLDRALLGISGTMVGIAK